MAIGTVSNDLLQTSLTGDATGKRLQTPASGPAAFSTATNLQVQVAAVDEASRNVQKAFNAANPIAQSTSFNGAPISTIQIQIVAGSNGQPEAQVIATNNVTGQVVIAGTVAPGQTVNGIENASIALGDFSTGDVGQTATGGAALTIATLSQIQNQLQLAVLAHRNAQPAGVLTLFNGR